MHYPLYWTVEGGKVLLGQKEGSCVDGLRGECGGDRDGSRGGGGGLGGGWV